MQILHLNPTLLSIHPDLDRVPMLHRLAGHFSDPKVHHGDPDRQDAAAEAGREWLAFSGDVAANGIREPLKVVLSPVGGPFTLWTLPQAARPWPVQIQIVDGRHRFTAALEAGLESVPCIEVQPAEIESIIAGSIIGRRHFTKGARAWLAVTLHPEAAESGRGGDRQSKNHYDSVVMVSQTDLAARFGVSQQLLSQACEIYRAIAKSPKVREVVEPSIWAGFGLGGILAGIGFVAAAQEQPGKVTKGSTNLTALKSAAGFVRRLAALTWATALERQLFVEELGATLGKLPPENRQALAEAMQSAEKAETLKTETLKTEKACKAPRPDFEHLAEWTEEQLNAEAEKWDADSDRCRALCAEIDKRVAARLAALGGRKPDKPAESLLTCPLCQTPNFTQKGLRHHVCKANGGKPLTKGQVLAAITAAA